MIADIIGGICFIAFLVLMGAICYIGMKYGDSNVRYYGYTREPKDPFYWTSTLTYPRENDKNV
jgi:hypothetical protein